MLFFKNCFRPFQTLTLIGLYGDDAQFLRINATEHFAKLRVNFEIASFFDVTGEKLEIYMQ